MGISKYNGERYYDPTCYKALAAVAGQEKKARRGKKEAGSAVRGRFMPKVYLCFPRQENEDASRYTRFAVETGYIPCSGQRLFPEYLASADSAERELGEFMCCVHLDGCREIWVFGDVKTPRMEKEVRRAADRGMRMRRFTEDCKEVRV